MADPRPFARPPRGDHPRGEEKAGGTRVGPARIFQALVAGGHARGHAELAERLTWRQIELFWTAAEEARGEDLAAVIAGAMTGRGPGAG